MVYRPSILRRGDAASALSDLDRQVLLPEGSELKKTYIEVIGKEIVDPKEMRREKEVAHIWFQCWTESFGEETINVKYKGTIDELRGQASPGEYVVGIVEYIGAGSAAISNGAFYIKETEAIYQDTASATTIVSIGTMFGLEHKDENSMDRIIAGLDGSHPRAGVKGDLYDRG